MPTLAREAGISQATGHRYLGEPALQALRTMRAFGRSPAADPSLPNMWEDDVRPAMESGRAAYQINWPFVHASMAANRPDMLPHFKWAPTRASPARVRPRWAAATSPSAPTPATPTTLCLRDAESQEIAAIRDGLPPTLRSLYDDPQLARAYPMRQAILDALADPAIRPQTPTYQNVSTVTSNVLSPPAAIDPPRTLKELRELISKALESKGVLP